MSGHGHQKKQNSRKQEVLIMIMTLGMGFVAGFYLYTTAFAPKFDELTGQTADVYSGLVLEGSQYGGDRLGGTAPSFQLLANGSFSYLPYAAAGDTVTTKEGVLPKVLLTEVKTVITKTALEKAALPVVRGECLSYVDALDYAYTVSLDDENYILDTCTTNLTVESNVGLTLDKLWNYFATLE